MNNNYENISLYEYLDILKQIELEKRIEKSIKEFDNIYKTLNEFNK